MARRRCYEGRALNVLFDPPRHALPLFGARTRKRDGTAHAAALGRAAGAAFFPDQHQSEGAALRLHRSLRKRGLSFQCLAGARGVAYRIPVGRRNLPPDGVARRPRCARMGTIQFLQSDRRSFRSARAFEIRFHLAGAGPFHGRKRPRKPAARPSERPESPQRDHLRHFRLRGRHHAGPLPDRPRPRGAARRLPGFRAHHDRRSEALGHSGALCFRLSPSPPS